jgi:hypothetical protein
LTTTPYGRIEGRDNVYVGFHHREPLAVLNREGGTIMVLAVGQLAPDFSLPSHTGDTVTLSDYRQKNVVLAFFPLAWTPV